MTARLARYGTVTARVVNILGRADKKAATDLSANVGRARNRFSKRVRGQEGQALCEAPFGLDLQRVIDRVTVGLIGLHVPQKVLVGTPGIGGCEAGGRRIDDLNGPVQIAISHVQSRSLDRKSVV